MRGRGQLDDRYSLSSGQRDAAVGRTGINIDAIRYRAHRSEAACQTIALISTNHHEPHPGELLNVRLFAHREAHVRVGCGVLDGVDIEAICSDSRTI
jgi:hypothetical protein